MLSSCHQQESFSEQEKINPLFGFQRMLLKERNDNFVQVLQPPDSKRHSLRVVSSHHAAPKEFLERMEELNVSLVLYDGKFGKHLELRGHFRVVIYANEETAFAVHESYHPVCF
jgi:hypothetical protein